jgi:DNA-binding MarR family transcriptional regulator
MSSPNATEEPSRDDVRDDFADDIVELERALTRISHLLTRVRRHDRAAAEAGVNVDRAGVPLLRILAEGQPALRLGELANRLGVEAPAVTRQVQRLERAGLVERVADPEDRRAQRVRATHAGREATDAIRAVGRKWMQEALSDWTPADMRALATLNHRMVDDFLAHAERVDAFGGQC